MRQTSFFRVGQSLVGLALLVLLLPIVGHAFDFGSVVDDVGKAVKSGAAAVEDGVRKVIPGDEGKKAGDGETAKPTAPAGEKAVKKSPEPARKATAKSSVFEENKESTAAGGKVSDQAQKTTGTTAAKTGVTADSPAETASSAPVAASAVPAAATNAKTNKGGTIFAKEPINPASPPPGVAAFAAGDRIYGMLKAAKPWKSLLGSSDYLIVYIMIDGQQKTSRTIGLKRPDLLAVDYFILDIAPDPAAMSNYSDRDIIFPEKDGLKFGPELFTKYLSELSPGKHTFRVEVKAYGDIYASGEFTIAGDNFASYAALLGEIKNSSGKQQKMPKPGMTDLALEKEMLALLKNGGWPDVRRLVIVDKDWWIDRVSGGDSPVASRHIEAAAAAKDSDGSYYYRHVTFHQPMLITGAWGKLQLTDTGKKKPIPEENINL
ncbi:MAG: hypothetical protein OEL83_05235 [Desulforhopalus sp.]|nr:hypothetical protein [Desulforhopalus sp.]